MAEKQVYGYLISTGLTSSHGDDYPYLKIGRRFPNDLRRPHQPLNTIQIRCNEVVYQNAVEIILTAEKEDSPFLLLTMSGAIVEQIVSVDDRL